MTSYTTKVIYHTVDNSEKVKNIQLFTSEQSAKQWANIQVNRGFTPVEVESNVDIDEGMIHIGNVSPQVHKGHYIQNK